MFEKDEIIPVIYREDKNKNPISYRYLKVEENIIDEGCENRGEVQGQAYRWCAKAYEVCEELANGSKNCQECTLDCKNRKGFVIKYCNPTKMQGLMKTSKDTRAKSRIRCHMQGIRREAEVKQWLEDSPAYLNPPKYKIRVTKKDKQNPELTEDLIGVAYPWRDFTVTQYLANVANGYSGEELQRLKYNLILQILYGIHAYAKKGYVHRDLKPANIMVEHVGSNPLIAIIDYDWMHGETLEKRGEVAEMPGGTLGYGYPKSFHVRTIEGKKGSRNVLCEGANVKWDFYSAALIAYEILEGRPHFEQNELGLSDEADPKKEQESMENETCYYKEEKLGYTLKPMPVTKKAMAHLGQDESYEELRRVLQKMMGNADGSGSYNLTKKGLDVIEDFENMLKKMYGKKYLSYFESGYVLKNQDERYVGENLLRVKCTIEDSCKKEEQHYLLAPRDVITICYEEQPIFALYRTGENKPELFMLTEDKEWKWTSGCKNGILKSIALLENKAEGVKLEVQYGGSR